VASYDVVDRVGRARSSLAGTAPPAPMTKNGTFFNRPTFAMAILTPVLDPAQQRLRPPRPPTGGSFDARCRACSWWCVVSVTNLGCARARPVPAQEVKTNTAKCWTPRHSTPAAEREVRRHIPLEPESASMSRGFACDLWILGRLPTRAATRRLARELGAGCAKVLRRRSRSGGGTPTSAVA